jgi:peptidoglycan/LPS O-acetylase OafA/YrhL
MVGTNPGVVCIDAMNSMANSRTNPMPNQSNALLPPPTIKKASRNLGLDLLRLLAVLLVIGNHLQPPSGGAGTLLAGWIRGGWVGVDLFFVLSGFLVTGLLFNDYLRNGRVSVARFLVRRGFKIYPAFWALIAFSLVVFRLKHQPVPFRNVMGELCFVQNYAAHIWPHTWSLAIEEHFYLCVAFFIFLLVRRPGAKPLSWFPAIFIVIATACLLLRIQNAMRYPQYDYSWDLFPTHLRIDSLFFGALLAYAAHFQRLEERLAWFPSWARLAAGSALLLPAFIFARETDRWITVIGFNLFYLGSGLLVLGAVQLRKSSSGFLRVLGAIGASSYSIYLWHEPVNAWFAAHMLVSHADTPHIYWLYLSVCVFGSLLAGCVMALVVETPLLKTRDRLYPSRARSLIAGNARGPTGDCVN